MKIKELINLLQAYNPELPVCLFYVPDQEYFEIDSEESVEKVWDEASKSWILSLNEDDESLKYRLTRFS